MNFPTNISQLIDDIVTKLKSIHGVRGIVVGGSYATGKQKEDSDIDFGIFYHEREPLDIKAVQELVKLLNEFPDPVVTNLGEWGKWVNGGAWLTINKKRVDFIYRNIDFVETIITGSKEGLIIVDYLQQPAFGFYSYIYCAEVFASKIVYDPEGILKNLKLKVERYPSELKRSIINQFLWDAEFTLFNAYKFAQMTNPISLAGCLTRITNDLIQVIYALNETYFISEKSIQADIELFKIKPHAFMSKLTQLVFNIGQYNNPEYNVLNDAKHLIKEIILLTPDYYKPPFSLKYV